MLRVAIIGAAGRMGAALVQSVADASDLELSGAVAEPGDPNLDKDAGIVAGRDEVGVPVVEDLRRGLEGAHVAIDFTLPAASVANASTCSDLGVPLVVGTTGLTDHHLEALTSASQQIPLVYGRNMSVGVNVFMELVRRGAASLGQDYDAEVFEAHHRHKIDAPSGTALAIGELIAEARGQTLDQVAEHDRHGTAPRVPGNIGFSVVRGGAIVGEHTVYFVSDEERLELTHRAADRKVFAKGALRAARWVAGRAPGLYGMSDVLGFEPSP